MPINFHSLYKGLQYATNEGLLFAETSAKSYEDLHKVKYNILENILDFKTISSL